MTHISKVDFINMLSTPIADERTELARRCFIFASLTSLSYIDVRQQTCVPLGDKKDIYNDVHTLGVMLGISSKLGFHASRHTFGVLMLNEGIPIGSIAKMMGHADITSTQVYAQVTEQKISSDMDKLIAKRENDKNPMA